MFVTLPKFESHSLNESHSQGCNFSFSLPNRLEIHNWQSAAQSAVCFLESLRNIAIRITRKFLAKAEGSEKATRIKAQTVCFKHGCIHVSIAPELQVCNFM